MVKRWFLVGVMLLLASLLVAGCGVPQEDYDAVVAERDAAQAQVASLQSDMSETQSQIETLESDLADAQAQLTTVQSDYDKVNSDLAKTQDEIDALEILILALSGSLPTTEVEVIYDIEYGNAKGIPLLLAQAADLSQVAVLNESAAKLAAAFWPGPLTLVLPRRANCSPRHSIC